jgi:ATP-dependent Clp protease adaptor protein ClpS
MGLDQRVATLSDSFFVVPMRPRSSAEWFSQLQSEPFDWHLPCINEHVLAMHGDVDSALEAVLPVSATIRNVDEPEKDHEHEHDVATATPQLAKPPFYVVVLFNDDYTPMEFVIEVLQQYFGLDLDHATEVMLSVHYQGKGVAGVYPRDIAETKAQQVNRHARAQGHPLLCQIEPESI